MTTVPIDSRDGVIWFDGKLVPWKDARIHVLTHGLHYGSCIFEGERSYDGVIYKCTEHSQRLHKSAEIMDFTIPYSVAELDEAKYLCLKENGLKDAYIRPVAWRGSEMMAVSGMNNTIHTAIAVWEWPSMFDMAQKLKGVRLDLATYRRPDPACAPVHAKAAGLYMICTMSKHAAQAKGCSDALMMDYRGYVAEATGANIFFVKEGAVHTPLADCFLNGLTRQTVIGLLRQKGIPVHERHILPTELAEFEQCWLTGTAAEVTPVGQIGAFQFEVGALARDIAQTYEAHVRA